MKYIICLFASFIMLESAFAGFNGLTYHSRANCGNNESISWDWTHDWVFYTQSDHYNARNGSLIHSVYMPLQMTWRSAAVHWGEGKGGWKVIGSHYRLYTDGSKRCEALETVTDCSIYDGWWDRNK